MKYCQQYQGGVHRLTRPTIIYDYYRYFRISPVWQEFDKLPGGISARCKIYHIKYKTGGGTSNLRNHLKKKHKLTVTPDKKADAKVWPKFKKKKKDRCKNWPNGSGRLPTVECSG